MRDIPKALQVYKHFKGTYYQVVTIAKHSETGEELVIYRPLFGGDTVYARPVDMFLSEVDHDKYPEVQQKYRFALATGNSKKPVAEAAENKVIMDEDDENIKENYDDIELKLDKDLENFLDETSFENKLDIFRGMIKTITPEKLSTIAMSLDFELSEESEEEQYRELLDYLKTRAKFECSRLR